MPAVNINHYRLHSKDHLLSHTPPRASLHRKLSLYSPFKKLSFSLALLESPTDLVSCQLIKVLDHVFGNNGKHSKSNQERFSSFAQVYSHIRDITNARLLPQTPIVYSRTK